MDQLSWHLSAGLVITELDLLVREVMQGNIQEDKKTLNKRSDLCEEKLNSETFVSDISDITDKLI